MTNTIKWDKPCYKCLSHLCDLSCKKTSKTEKQDDEVLGFNGWGFPIEKPNKVMTTQTEALKALIHEMEYVLSCINEDKIPFDGDDFHEALRLGKEALSQTENDKERCVGCEACIDTACGRDECPKGWPKAAQPEQEPVAWMYPDALCDKACLYLCTKGFTQFPECATPPQRTAAVGEDSKTWVGLTQTEVVDLLCEYNKLTGNVGWQQLIYITEAKLKEKNT